MSDLSTIMFSLLKIQKLAAKSCLFTKHNTLKVFTWQQQRHCSSTAHEHHHNSTNKDSVFVGGDETVSFVKIVEHAADVLPTQAILENFIHHNPLHHFESMHFDEAVAHVHQLESTMSPGERVFSMLNVDPRKRTNEALVELCAPFLDRGAAKWAPDFRDRGFLYFFATLENLGHSPWRKHARETSNRIIKQLTTAAQDNDNSLTLAESILLENLKCFGVPPDQYTAVTRVMMLELRGWAGMFRRMETHPSETPPNTKVRLIEFCAVQSILTRSSIESLAKQSGLAESSSLANWLSSAPTIREQAHEITRHTSAIAYVDQTSERREHLEQEFQQTLLHAIGSDPIVKQATQRRRPFVQLYTCIDDRECSFRRLVEEANPRDIETFGVAGFFGIPIRFRAADGGAESVLAPEGNNPQALLIESEKRSEHDKFVRYNRRRHLFAQLSLMWENASFNPIGSLLLSALVPISLTRLTLMSFAPDTNRTLTERITNAVLSKPHTEIEPLPYTAEQAAQMLARTFKDVGHTTFAPIIVVLGHGAISVNNPFAAAYNCGACGGREGGPNARLLARLANDAAVRARLASEHNITIPTDTHFVGGVHNTTADTVEYFDLDRLPVTQASKFEKVRTIIEEGRANNALERTERFLLAKHVYTPYEALQYVRTRSSDAAEVRPELNHASNAAVVVGRRELTKGRFLDRRVFLPSYDPHSDDERGTNLEHVLAPALIVCSGINLEYLFSTVNVESHGAGTKAPLNIVGNIGVLQGTAGDLRTGLPSQMTEMHTPIRALYVIDAPIARVEAVLARRNDLRQLVHNEWVRFVVRDPTNNLFFRQSKGNYYLLDTVDSTRMHVPFAHHRVHGMRISRREDLTYYAANVGMLLSCAMPIYMYGAIEMNPRGTIIAICGTALSLPALAFARRYLHGEFTFARFSVLCVGLLLGFDLVAVAPTIEHALAGWSLFGFASTFLIGSYNDRTTVRNNATFAFAAYQISDFALLIAAAFSVAHSEAHFEKPQLVAAGLIVAAMFKSSQFPLTALFVRSMEGPTPASALGYAGLSAHVGVVLLSGTMPLWFVYDWARLTVGSIGAFTAISASMVSRVRADRKGAIANATSATLGAIYIVLALGYSDLALLMSFGHAAFRMTQILRSPNVIADSQRLRSALGYMPWPKIVPNWLYRLSWAANRFFSDLNFLHLLQLLGRGMRMPKRLQLNKYQQWIVTAIVVFLAGLPFTPLTHLKEELFIELLQAHSSMAFLIKFVDLVISVALIRFLFVSILNPRRFHRIYTKNQKK